MKPSVIIAPNQNTSSRDKLASALQVQGASASPVGHWSQALARLMQAYVGSEIKDDISTQQQNRQSSARNTLTDALADYRGDKPNYSAQGPQQSSRGTGTDRAAMMQTLQSNPDTADFANQSELARVMAGTPDPKIPSGYQKAAGGGVEQIPGWINSSRYKQVSYIDEQGNTQNAVIDVAQLQGGGASTSMDGQPGQPAQPGQPTVGPNGMINLGTQKEKMMTVEAGAKAAMMQQGMKDLKSAQPMLFNDKGELDRVNATNAWLNTPGTEGRLIYSYYFNAINAKLRAESGAAVPEEEVSRGMKVFMPSPMDNDITAQEKITRLHEFMNSSLTNMDATGRLVPADSGLREWMGQEERKVAEYDSLPHPKTQDDFQSLQKGTMYVDPEDGKRYIK